MGKGTWKQWPEMQYRFAADEKNAVRVYARTYTEHEGKLTAHYADIALTHAPTQLSESCLGELRKLLRDAIEPRAENG